MSKEIRGDTTNCGYKFEQKCTAKEMLSTSLGSLLNNLPYEISGDRSGAQIWDILTALRAALQFLLPLLYM